MPNPTRGEASLGDYTLRFDINAFCELEDALDAGMQEILATISAGMNFRTARAVVRAGLLHSDPAMTDQRAGEIISDNGLEASLEAVGAAIAAALPSAEGKAPKAAAKPRRAGTGNGS